MSNSRFRAKVHLVTRIIILMMYAIMIPSLWDLYQKDEAPNDQNEDTLHLLFTFPTLFLEIANIANFLAMAPAPSNASAQASLLRSAAPDSQTPEQVALNERACCTLFSDIFINLSIPIYTSFAARQNPKDSLTLGLLFVGLAYNLWKLAPMVKALWRERQNSEESRHSTQMQSYV